MACYVEENCYLQFIEGKKSNSSYEFACECYDQLVQNQASYFALDLDELYPNSNILKENEKQSMIVGVLYDFQYNFSLNVKQFISYCLKESIYFKQGEFLDGFENLISAIKNFIYSSESQKNFNKKGQINSRSVDFFMVNLMLKVGDKIYISKSISTLDIVNNQWYIKMNDSYYDNYQQLDKQEDLVDYQSNYYQIKQNLTKNLKEIILTSKQCNHRMIVSNIKDLYPRQHEYDISYHTYFLKIKF
ncbi:hypothetical protein ABPG74_009982 [Tetrahymena malaccensis]